MTEPNLEFGNKIMGPKFSCVSVDLKAKRHQPDEQGDKKCYKPRRTRSRGKNQPES